MAALKRSDVPQEQVWTLADIFQSEEDFDGALKELNNMAQALRGHQATLGSSEVLLLNFLRDRDEVLALAARITSYAMLKFSEDGSDAHHQMLMGRAASAAQGVESALTDLQNTYLSLDEDKLQSFSNQDLLVEYRQYLLGLVNVHLHKLSPEAEAALAAVSETLAAPGNLYRSATGGDLHCGTVVDEEGKEFLVTPFSVMVRAETSYDSGFRKRAYNALTDGLKPYHNTLGTSLSIEIKKNVSFAKLRGYKSTADMLLHESDVSGFPSDDVSVAF